MLLIASSALLATMALQADTRAAASPIVSRQTLVDLQACATRKMAKVGRVQVIPRDNGVELDFHPKTLMGPSGQAPYGIRITDTDDQRSIETYYRHPWSAKAAAGLTKDLAKTCFREEWEANVPEQR